MPIRTQQKNSSTKKSLGNSQQNGTQEAREKDHQQSSGYTKSNSNQSTTGLSDEHAFTQSIDMESSLNLSEVTSTTQKKNEKWFIDRQFYQMPNTVLKVQFFEKTVEAKDVPFKAHIHVGGHIGLILQDHISLRCDPYLDYWDGNMWCLSAATIIKCLPAPGYITNTDGSVSYTIRGRLTLKHPIDIVTKVTVNDIAESNHTQIEPSSEI